MTNSEAPIESNLIHRSTANAVAAVGTRTPLKGQARYRRMFENIGDATTRAQNRIVAAVFLIIALAAGPASALECPVPQMEASDGTLKETPAAITAASQTLAARGSAAIPGMIYRLRQRFPRSSNAAIMNYMVTAYCPVVNRKTAISENQKKALLTRFESQITARL
jgi:hypothetical protein